MDTLDYQARELALDITRSFIVQAPAGSGKTELLVQRILALLAHVKKAPEEILAITFTRKAAAEMRARIIDALRYAHENPEPERKHKKITWRLAREVLDRDQKLKWQLLTNPKRLQIQTIDSFCNYLVQQMPLLSGFGMQPQVAEDATEYYLQAARNLLQSLEDDEDYAVALEKLLLYLDNNYNQVEKLLVGMLARRDQWLPYIVNQKNSIALRSELEEGLRHIVLDNFKKCTKQLDNELVKELLELANFAAQNLHELNIASNIKTCINLHSLPPIDVNYIKQWQGLANLLINNDFQWRKQYTIRNGFPADKDAKPYKQRIQNLIQQLQAREDLRQTLQDILQAPPAFYTDSQWQVIESLVVLLPFLAAQLSVIFYQNGIVDFSEVSMAALKALGDTESPTELALYLDHQIQHILVDEFQDTSMMQFRLLEKLMTEWQPNDGHSLFLVGDPMQSIYRFREAEVGLFLKAQQEGIGNIRLESLILTTNFRSDPLIVDWVNQQFTAIFPKIADISSGAIPYSPSAAAREADHHADVKFHPFIEAQPQIIAKHLVGIIQQEQQSFPERTIAVLVRSRSHLLDLLPALKQENIQFSAVEIERLANNTLIGDAVSLTYALMHLSDRIAWLAILRAPWCGLSLADLYNLAGNHHGKPLWNNLINYEYIKNLSEEGKSRLARVTPILDKALANRNRKPLRLWIEGAWLALGGPTLLKQPSDFINIQTFFKLLEEMDEGGEIKNYEIFEQKINKLYVAHQTETHNKLQIMTIHKAKGLEFDTVIIPGLEYRSSSDENQLLMWMDRPRAQGKNDLILAPIKSAEEIQDTIYQYVRNTDKKKAEYENGRLLYVAITRAKKTVHLSANVTIDPKTEQLAKPISGSFLSLLWDKNKKIFDNAAVNYNNLTDEQLSAPRVTPKLMRLVKDWKIPQDIHASFPKYLTVIDNTNYECRDGIHQQLSKIIFKAIPKLFNNEINSIDNYIKQINTIWQKMFQQMGMPQPEIHNQLNLLNNIFSNIIHDKRVKWFYTEKKHLLNANQILTLNTNEGWKQIKPDLAFIDEQEQYWLINFITESVTNDKQDKAKINIYQKILEQQAQTLYAVINKPIKLGLYFPLSATWLEWEYEAESEVA